MSQKSDNKPPKQILTESFTTKAREQGSEYLSKISKPSPQNNNTPNPKPK